MAALSGKKNAHAPSEVVGRASEVAGGPFKFVTSIRNGDECSQVGWTKVTRARCRPARGRRIAGRAR